MDFVQLLYAKVQLGRGDSKTLKGITPYLSGQIMSKIKMTPSHPDKVEDVIVGSSNITQINSFGKRFDNIIVEFEANYKEYKGRLI